jgi:hypothetical protein
MGSEASGVVVVAKKVAIGFLVICLWINSFWRRTVVPSFHLGGAPFVTSWTSGSEPIVGRSYKLNPLAPSPL